MSRVTLFWGRISCPISCPTRNRNWTRHLDTVFRRQNASNWTRSWTRNPLEIQANPCPGDFGNGTDNWTWFSGRLLLPPFFRKGHSVATRFFGTEVPRRMSGITLNTIDRKSARQLWPSLTARNHSLTASSPNLAKTAHISRSTPPTPPSNAKKRGRSQNIRSQGRD